MPSPSSKSKPLTLRQEKFVQALTTPKTPAFCNQTAAYSVISPSAVPPAQANGGYRMMRNDDIQQAVKGQLGLDKLGSGLKLCLRESKKLMRAKEVSTKLPAMREHRETLMDYAKLTGQLVEKREIKTVNDVDRSVIRGLVQSAMSDNKHSVKLDN